MKKFLLLSIVVNLLLIYYIAKRYYYSKVPPILWHYDVALLGDSHIYRANWNELLGVRAANFGVGGNTTKQMYDRLPGVINCRPGICFIEGGINDIQQGMPLDSTVHYLKLIRDRLIESRIKPVFMQVMHVRGWDSANIKVDSLNARIYHLGDYISAPITYDDLQEDSIHLNGSGYQKWARVISKMLPGDLQVSK